MTMNHEDFQDLLEEISASRIINLSSKRGLSPFDTKQANEIAIALSKSPSLQHLCLFFAKESENCKKILSGALRNASLQKLYLQLSGPEEAESLAESLKCNSTLVELALSSGYGHLGNDARAKTVPDLAIKLITDALKVHKSIQRFVMHGGWLNAEDAKVLSEIIEYSNSLKEFEISNNNIGCDGAEAIASSLAKNTTLQILNLNSTGIGPRGATALADAIKVNNVLRQLHLDRNEIGLRGIRAIKVALDSNTILVALSLPNSSSSLVNDEILSIRKVLQQNRSLQEKGQQTIIEEPTKQHAQSQTPIRENDAGVISSLRIKFRTQIEFLGRLRENVTALKSEVSGISDEVARFQLEFRSEITAARGKITGMITTVAEAQQPQNDAIKRRESELHQELEVNSQERVRLQEQLVTLTRENEALRAAVQSNLLSNTTERATAEQPISLLTFAYQRVLTMVTNNTNTTRTRVEAVLRCNIL